jgi:hypothetical protein
VQNTFDLSVTGAIEAAEPIVAGSDQIRTRATML